MAAKKGGGAGFPGAFTAVGVLVVFAAIWPAVVFHGSARWVGEGLWVGIPALTVVTAITVNYWTHRDERKLKRLRDERLWAEGKHPNQLRAQQERRLQEQKLLLAEQRNREARLLAEQRKQQMREEIEREERLRQERLRRSR